MVLTVYIEKIRKLVKQFFLSATSLSFTIRANFYIAFYKPMQNDFLYLLCQNIPRGNVIPRIEDVWRVIEELPTQRHLANFKG